MKRRLLLSLFILSEDVINVAEQKVTNQDGTHTYYIATDGNDYNDGSVGTQLMLAHSLVVQGNTVFICGGTYTIPADIVLATTDNSCLYADINYFAARAGASASKSTYYWGYKNERPVFDFSNVNPVNQIVTAFYVSVSYYYFKNFEVTRVQVTITAHTQSQCFRNAAGNYNTYENVSMGDGQAIGFYLTKGAGNYVHNCDAHNNYDSTSEGGAGGNTDGFGYHPSITSGMCNVFRGCRAWLNSDDGSDLINAFAAVTFDSGWSFYNGYSGTLSSFVSRGGDGNDFKSVRFGMGAILKYPPPFPQHTVEQCLAYYNKQNGFYANHHLTGDYFYNNTTYRNSHNYYMVNRQYVANALNLPGYRYTLKNNISYSPRTSGDDITNIDLASDSAGTSNYNSFSIPLTTSLSDFNSLDATQLTLSQNADGSLPNITFLTLKSNSQFIDRCTAAGLSYSEADPHLGYAETASSSLTVRYSSELSARIIKGLTVLTWTTETEINNEGFSIQKSGDGASRWQTMGFVKSHFEYGNGIGYNYQYTDSTSLRGLTFYRLKQTDINGKYAYSDIVSIQPSISSNPRQILLYSIAGSAAITLNLNILLRIPVIAHLYHIGGQILRTCNFKPNGDLYTLTIPFLNQGLYVLQVFSGNINVGSSKLLVN